MNLGKNINSLLKRYAEVYVPGIGVFKRIHSPAQFDKQNNVFLPPISYVELDYSAQHGFNIVHYIQQHENLGLSQAQQILSEAVDNLRADLNQFGQAKLDDLGLLISYGASLVFKPLDLSGFDFQPVTNLVAPEIETVVSSLEEATEKLAESSPLNEHPGGAAETAVVEEFVSDTQVQEIAIPEEDTPEEESKDEVVETVNVPVAHQIEDEPIPETETTSDSFVIEPEVDLREEEKIEEPEPADETALMDSDEPIGDEVVTQKEQVQKKELGAIAAANAHSTYVPDVYEEEPRHSNAMWYWITGIIVLAMVGLGVIYTNPSLKDTLFGTSKPVVKTPDTLAQDKQIIPADTLPSALMTDSLKKTDSLAQTKVTDTVKNGAPQTAAKASVLEANPVIKESIPVAQPKYQLVIGSAKTMVQAELEAKRLREMGYKTARAVEGKYKRNRKKIILNTYMTKSEADLAKKSVEKKIEGAWVEKL